MTKRNVGPAWDPLVETVVANSKPKAQVGQFPEGGTDARKWTCRVPGTSWLVFLTTAPLLNSILGCVSRRVNYGGGPQMRCHGSGFTKEFLSPHPHTPTSVNMPWLWKQMPSLLWCRVNMSHIFKNIAPIPLKTYQVMPKYKFQSLDHDFQKTH